MKIISLLTLAACTCFAPDELPKTDIDAYMFGLSKHTNRAVDYNEKNPGLALGLTHRFDNLPTMTLIAGSYLDSYRESARFAVAGPVKVWGDRESFHSTLGIAGGYFEGSDWNGVGFVPFASLGYDRFDVCVTGIPYLGRPYGAKGGNPDPKYNRDVPTGMIAVFVKIRLASF